MRDASAGLDSSWYDGVVSWRRLELKGLADAVRI